MKILPILWESERLLIRDAVLDDVQYLRAVFNACSYVSKWDKTFYRETEEAFIKLVSKSLFPSQEATEIFKMQSVLTKSRPGIIGYFHLYHGAPRPEIVWISMFVLHPAYQQNRFGSELAQGLYEQIKILGAYSAIWVWVSLKNWPALHFWIDQDFDRVVKYEGDHVHAEDTHASLVLEKRL